MENTEMKNNKLRKYFMNYLHSIDGTEQVPIDKVNTLKFINSYTKELFDCLFKLNPEIDETILNQINELKSYLTENEEKFKCYTEFLRTKVGEYKSDKSVFQKNVSYATLIKLQNNKLKLYNTRKDFREYLEKNCPDLGIDIEDYLDMFFLSEKDCENKKSEIDNTEDRQNYEKYNEWNFNKKEQDQFVEAFKFITIYCTRVVNEFQDIENNITTTYKKKFNNISSRNILDAIATVVIQLPYLIIMDPLGQLLRLFELGRGWEFYKKDALEALKVDINALFGTHGYWEGIKMESSDGINTLFKEKTVELLEKFGVIKSQTNMFCSDKIFNTSNGKILAESSGSMIQLNDVDGNMLFKKTKASRFIESDSFKKGEIRSRIFACDINNMFLDILTGKIEVFKHNMKEQQNMKQELNNLFTSNKNLGLYMDGNKIRDKWSKRSIGDIDLKSGSLNLYVNGKHCNKAREQESYSLNLFENAENLAQALVRFRRVREKYRDHGDYGQYKNNHSGDMSPLFLCCQTNDTDKWVKMDHKTDDNGNFYSIVQKNTNAKKLGDNYFTYDPATNKIYYNIVTQESKSPTEDTQGKNRETKSYEVGKWNREKQIFYTYGDMQVNSFSKNEYNKCNLLEGENINDSNMKRAFKKWLDRFQKKQKAENKLLFGKEKALVAEDKGGDDSRVFGML